MLGLGDIVIPGIFVALCLKFDIDRCLKTGNVKSLTQISVPYFNTAFIGYVVGICATFAAMYIFDHAQPALLFLVPSCTISVLLLSVVRGELEDYKNYESSPEPKEGEKKDESNKDKWSWKDCIWLPNWKAILKKKILFSSRSIYFLS